MRCTSIVMARLVAQKSAPPCCICPPGKSQWVKPEAVHLARNLVSYPEIQLAWSLRLPVIRNRPVADVHHIPLDHHHVYFRLLHR